MDVDKTAWHSPQPKHNMFNLHVGCIGAVPESRLFFIQSFRFLTHTFTHNFLHITTNYHDFE